MALKTKDSGKQVQVNRTVKIDTDGNNYLGTTGVGYRGATIVVSVDGGSATSFTIGKARNDDKDSTPTVDEYENGAVTATGGDVSINCGENVDLYLVVAGASSLNASVAVSYTHLTLPTNREV